ncbi:MAG: type I 3-dehydroquinate dehydratase, partial [Acidobacteriota bacterium]
MFPPVCIALGFSDVESLLSHARDEYQSGERFLEFRLDYLPDPKAGLPAIQKFLAEYSDCTILATCRRRQNQGRFVGSIEEQLKILDAAREAGAHAVDLEIESAENCEDKLADLSRRNSAFAQVLGVVGCSARPLP